MLHGYEVHFFLMDRYYEIASRIICILGVSRDTKICVFQQDKKYLSKRIFIPAIHVLIRPISPSITSRMLTISCIT